MKHFLLPRSLRGRLVLLILAALLVAQAVSVMFFVDERGLAVRNALGLEAAGRAANVVRLIEEAPPDLHNSIIRSADSPLVRFSLDPTPTVDHTSHNGGDVMAARLRSILGQLPNREIRVELHDVIPMTRPMRGMPHDMHAMHRAMLEQQTQPVQLLLSIALANGGGWLNVQTMFHRPPLQFAWSSLLTFGLSAALIAVVVWFALGQIVGPLKALSGAADQLGRGEEVEEIAPRGPDELRRLTNAFNDMQARLTRFIAERMRLLAALGHDLRSPLTAMRIRLELLDDEENRERLTAMVDEMQAMVEATLTFARGLATSEASTCVDIGELLRNLTAEVREAGGVAQLDAEGTTMARVRPTAIKRAFRNIVENAVRYGGMADIQVCHKGDLIEVSVSDGGPGLPEESLEAVFEPFVRLEDSRSRETGGIGLGLAIARTIIHAHGGDIRLANRPEGGLLATITLPTGGA